MGGSNSGSWYRWGAKATTESQRRIDIRWMKKKGYLQPENSGSISWSCRGEQTGYIRYSMEADRVILNYRHRSNGGDWEQIEDVVFFNITLCNYGGCRKWFICPRCQGRVAILYGGKHLRCRHCHNLTYSSQQESPPFRLLRKAQNIRARLGAGLSTDDPIYEKPKGMHRITFYRLKKEAEKAGNEAMKKACEYFGE